MTIIKIYLIFSMLAILWSDVRRYIIPNWLVASLLILYPIGIMMAPQAVDWKMAIVGMGVIFAAGFGIFAMKWMGAGDIKLLTACSLWVGFSHLLEYVFIVAILGGMFSAFLWGSRKLLPGFAGKLPFKTTPRILREGEPVPYGVAIAVGFLLMLWMGKLPLLAGH